MNAYPIASVLWANSAAAGLLVLLVLLVQWLFRRHLNPQWRCALWLVVVTRLVLPVSIGSPVSLMQWLPQPAGPEPAVMAPVPQALSPVRGAPVAGQRTLPFSTAPSLAPTAFNSGAVHLSDDSPVKPAPVPLRDKLPWAALLFWTWLAGIAVLVANVLRVTAKLSRRFSKLPACTDPVVLDLLQDCASRMSLRRIPVVVESPDVASPALHGFLRPCLLLPAGFARDFAPAEMRLVFLHEFAHLKRRDLPLNWLITGLQIVHWFNPLLWLGFAHWRADREIACDALALETAGADQNQNYGRTILHLLERNGPRFAGSGLVGILEDRRQLRRRMEMISAFVPARRRSLLALVLVGALAAVGLTDAQTAVPQSATPTPAVTSSPPAASVPHRGYTIGDTLRVSHDANGAVERPLRFVPLNPAEVGRHVVLRGAFNTEVSAEAMPARYLVTRVYADGTVAANLVLRVDSSANPSANSQTLSVVRINPDGTLNPNFQPAQEDLTEPVGDPLSRNFETPATDKSGRWRFVRLNPDGTVNTTFNSGPALTLKEPLFGAVRATEVQPDETVIVSDSFQSTNQPAEPAREYLARVRPDGRLVVAAFDAKPRNPLVSGLAQTSAAPAPAVGGPAAAPQMASSGNNANAGIRGRDDTLSIDFPEEDIRGIVRKIADLFQLDIVIPESLEGKASIKLRDVTWRQIFKAVLEPVGHTFVEDGNIIKIVSNETLLQEPMVTEVFTLNFAKAADAVTLVADFINTAGGGKIQVDAHSNSLIITDAPSRITKVRPLIEQLERAAAQARKPDTAQVSPDAKK